MNKRIISTVNLLVSLMVLLLVVTVILFSGTICIAKWPELFITEKTVEAPKEELPPIVDGIHVASGLKADDGLELIIQNCTPCHSAKMITQNKADAAGWKSMIVWMQETQQLWDLGENEEKIIAYLSKNYPPEKAGRRAPLTNIDWYELED